MSESMGVIYYEVDADTGKLVNSTAAMDKSLDGLQKGFDKTDRQAAKFNGQMTKVAEGVKRANMEAQGATGSVNGLYKAFAALLSLRAANSLIEMAEAYNTYAERIRMATSSQEEFEMVQRRLLETANGTYRAMSEAQEVYIRTADSLRDMGYSTEQALDITDSLSYAFVRNEASVDRANSAISAYSKSITKGRVDAQAWESITSAIPTVINDIAEASGKSAQEIRRLGAEGKISARELNEGLRRSLEANKSAADGMATTVKDAFTNLKNNLSVYLGEANQATGATTLMSSAIVGLGENIETIVKLLSAAGAGAMANYVAKLGSMTIAAAKSALESRRQAIEELRLAAAHERAAAHALRHAQANAGLMGTHSAAARAAETHRIATERLAAAQKAASVGISTIARLLGGPVGMISLAATAAAGLYLFRDGSNAAEEGLIDLSAELTTVVKQFQALDEAQRRVQERKWADEEKEKAKRVKQAYEDLSSAAAGLRESAIQMTPGSSADVASQFDAWLAVLDRVQKEGGDVLPVLDQIAERFNLTDGQRRQLEGLAASYGKATGNLREHAEARERLNKALADGPESPISTDTPPPEQDSAEAEKRLQKMREEAELLRKIGVEREKLKAIQDLGSDASDAQKLEAARLAETIHQLEKEEEARKNIEKAREKDVQTLDEMRNKLEQAAVSGEELAKVKARQALSEWATEEEIEQIEELAAAIWDLEEADRKRKKFGDTSGDAWRHIQGNVTPLSGGMFDNQRERYQAEADEEKRRYEESIKELEKARELKIDIGRSYDEAEEDLAKQHAKRMAQIEKARHDMAVSQAGDAFGQMASDLGAYIQEYGSKNKDLMRTMKAAAIAQTIIQTYLGAQQAFTALSSIPLVGPALGAAAAAAAIAGGMARVSAIRSQQAGGRQYGGPVAAGSMYRVNENGRPEVFKASNGQQYMIPNTRGEVVSNKDASGGSSATVVNLNVVESQERGGEVERTDGPNGSVTITAFVADIRRDGPASKALSQTFGLKRRGK